MHIDKKVGITLDVIGLTLLVLSAVFKLSVFWPVFGMACVLGGTYKLVTNILAEGFEAKNYRRIRK